MNWGMVAGLVVAVVWVRLLEPYINKRERRLDFKDFCVHGMNTKLLYCSKCRQLGDI